MNKLKFMYKSYFHKILLILLLSVIFGGYRFGPDDDIYTKINKNMDVFGKVFKEIALNYVDEIEQDKFIKAGIEGMLNTLDPYTNFLDESRKDEIDLLTTGKYGGIGITIGVKDSMIIITEILEGYSAQKEGLRKGDKILEIEGTNLIGKKIGDVRALARGEIGTQVKMKIKRGEGELEFTLTRQEIKLKNVGYNGILEDGIGYIKLERFNKYAENEVIEALTEIKSKGELKGIVLDLRDNPGGLLDAAVNIISKFVDRGSLIVTTKGRKPDSEKKFFSYEDPMLKKEVPLVVIINQNSASASEIVAGAIQDLDRGVLIGSKTFGKGLVQVYTPLSYGTQLKITNQKYYTPSGRWIQSKNYFKENKYGVFKPNPFFNQIEFKTLNGRTVYAEGGIIPDLVVKDAENNELLDELSSQDMYFKFAEKYVNENTDPQRFVMDDVVLISFYNFLISSGFEFTTSIEAQLSILKKSIDEKKYSDNVKNRLAELESQIKQESLKDFETSKQVLRKSLILEILKKYNKSEKEIMKASLEEDTLLRTAINIIKNRESYNRFLNIQ